MTEHLTELETQASQVESMRQALFAAKYCLEHRHTCSGYTVDDTLETINAALGIQAPTERKDTHI